MVRKNLKGATYAFIIGLLVSVSAIAFAGEVASPWKNINGYQYPYRDQAKCVYDANGVYAYTWVDAQGATVPAGYMGAQSFLYNTSGACILVSSIQYTSYNATYIAVSTSHWANYGTYWSNGLAYIWNTSSEDYVPFSTYNTPNLTY